MIPGALPVVLRKAVEPEEHNPDEPQIARFWRAETVAPKAGDLITVHTHGGQRLAAYDVLMTCADHLVVGLHERPAFAPNPKEVPRAA